MKSLPDVPTFAESGLPGVDTSPIFGLIAPAGVPTDIIDQLSSTLAKSVQHGELHQQLVDRGFVPIGSTPAEFSQRIREEVEKWTKLIHDGGFEAE